VSDPSQADIVMSGDDIRRAVSLGLIQRDDAERLLSWASARTATASTSRERVKGLNLVS